jgi:hypothetical protein
VAAKAASLTPAWIVSAIDLIRRRLRGFLFLVSLSGCSLMAIEASYPLKPQ